MDQLVMTNIMVIDDSKFWRKVVCGSLEKAQFKVIAEAGDGEEALDVFHAIREIESIDIITIDVLMPKLNGIEVIKEILKVDPTICIVAMTGLGHTNIIDEILDLGVAKVLIKPVSASELVNILESLSSSSPLKQMIVYSDF